MNLPEIIVARLAQYQRGLKTSRALSGLAELCLVAGVGVVLVVVIEWALRPSLDARVWLSGAVWAVVALGLIYRVLVPVLRPWTLREVAGRFEAAAKGHFQERILSAVELAEAHRAGAQPGVSSWMAGRTVALAAEEIGAVDAATLIDSAPAKRAWMRTAGLFGVLGLACLIPGVGPRLLLGVYPYAPTAPLSKIQLTVSPGDCRLRQGASMQIRVSASAPLDEVRAWIAWEDGFRESVAMAGSATNHFVLDLPAVVQSFRYSVQGVDAESPLYTARVDVPPRLGALRLVIEPPDYTHWTNRVVEGGNADFLNGSRVRLVVEAVGERVIDAQWVPEGFPARQLKAQGGRWELELQPTNAFTYQLRLAGANGLATEPPQKWTLRPVADEPPVAGLRWAGLSEGGGQPAGGSTGLVQRDEVLPLEISATDDVGLKEVGLFVLARDAEGEMRAVYPGSAPPKDLPTEREVRSRLAYNLADLPVLTGEEVQFQVLATDVRGQTTRSEPLTVTIGSVDLAEEARMAERLKQMGSTLEAQLEYLRQTRTSWLSLARNFRENDPGAQGPAMVLLQSRLEEFSRSVAAVGEGLVSESETAGLAEARFLYRLGSALSVWAKQQREVLAANCGRLSRPGVTDAGETFSLGRELFSLALTDLEQYRRVLGVLHGVFETGVLAARCESAQGRYKRGLAVMRGQKNIIGPLTATASGLLATFFDGPDLRGRILEQKIDNPRFDNYAPANHREQWSCRYEGEIQITESGDWTLGCIADDGVRLRVAGKSVLPPGAWSPHPATPYQGDLTLSSGWHPIVIEFFQGYSESKLRLLAGRKGQALEEVPLDRLRPLSVRRPERELATKDPALKEMVQDALNQRVKAGLDQVASVPPTLVPFTNLVQNEKFILAVGEKLPVGGLLASNLATFASWRPEEAETAETQADDLTALSKEAQRILREELEKYRWRYEGAAALREIANALQELRGINEQFRRPPHNPSPQRTEDEQAKVDLAKAWEKQLANAAASAAHRFFEIASQKQATLAERIIALNAAAKAQKDLPPAIEKLASTLETDLKKDELANQVDARLNEITDRYRELNEMQENINREQVAAEARMAWPAARAFARARAAADNTATRDKYEAMQARISPVARAQRVAGDYQGAARLESLAGDSPADAQGKETANELRDLAQRTSNNPPSLAQAIPPPMRQQAEALEKQAVTPRESADELAVPRLAMSLEAARLFRQGDSKAALAYDLLGEDTGALLATPESVTAPAVRPLAERAAALAGLKGDAARQAEIHAATERLQQMAGQNATAPLPLAAQLDQLSATARQAADEAGKRSPLTEQLGQMAGLTTPSDNWTGSSDARRVAASAAGESLSGIQSAPNKWDSYHSASQVLADAARQIRMDVAVGQLGELDPYALPAASATSEAGAAATGSSGESRQAPVLPPPVPRGADQAEWARLSERLRQAIRSSGIEHFSEEQQVAIRAYFERLSSGVGK